MKYKNTNLSQSGIKTLYISTIVNVKRDADMAVF